MLLFKKRKRLLLVISESKEVVDVYKEVMKDEHISKSEYKKLLDESIDVLEALSKVLD